MKYALDSTLVGAKVTEVDLDAERFPFMILKKGKVVTTVYFSADAEQNGPGCPIVLDGKDDGETTA